MRDLAEPVLDVDPPVVLRGKVADDVRRVAGEPGGAAQVLRQRGAARLSEVKRPLVGQQRGRLGLGRHLGLPGASPAVLRLVDCSLLGPPRAGPDDRSRYVMLETLRAYGAGLLARAGEQDGAAAALARYALQVAGQAAAGLQSGDGELAAARWLDAEDATMRQALGWAIEHDTSVALRLANALGRWWILRGRLAGEYRLLCQAAGHAEAGSDGWCAAQIWLGWA